MVLDAVIEGASMTASLMNHPPPHTFESVQGFLLRLAEANAYPGVEWLQCVDDLRAQLRALVGTTIFGFVPKWLDISETPAVVPAVFEQRLCLGRRARCCAACLSAVPYGQAIWEHRLYVACHLHGLELVETCHACGSPLSWKRASMTRCHCGSEISTWEQVEASRFSVDVAQHIWRAFVGVIGGSNDATPLQVGVLDGVSLPSIASLICQLGATTETTEYMLSPKVWRNLTSSDTHRLIAVAYSRLTDWPFKFHDFLREEDRSIEDHGVALRQSLRVRRLKKFLFRALPPDLNFLLDGFRGYMREQSLQTLDHRHPWATTDDLQSQAYVAANVAARQLGVRVSTLHALATRVGVKAIRKPGQTKRHFTLIQRAALSSLKQHLADEISLRTTGKLLGISASRVEQLADVGLLTRRTITHGLVSTSLFQRREALALIDSIRNNGRVLACTDQEISIVEACRYFLSRRAEFVSLVRAMQEGRLSLKRWDESAPGLAGAILRRREFLEWHRQQCCIGGMTVPEAAAHLHVKQEVAYHLVKSGLLKGRVAIRGRRTATMITPDSLSDFERRYISSVELAAAMSLSAGRVIAILSDLGVSPVCGPQADGSRQNIFRRRDVDLVSGSLKAFPDSGAGH